MGANESSISTPNVTVIRQETLKSRKLQKLKEYELEHKRKSESIAGYVALAFTVIGLLIAIVAITLQLQQATTPASKEAQNERIVAEANERFGYVIQRKPKRKSKKENE